MGRHVIVCYNAVPASATVGDAVNIRSNLKRCHIHKRLHLEYGTAVLKPHNAWFSIVAEINVCKVEV